MFAKRIFLSYPPHLAEKILDLAHRFVHHSPRCPAMGSNKRVKQITNRKEQRISTSCAPRTFPPRLAICWQSPRVCFPQKRKNAQNSRSQNMQLRPMVRTAQNKSYSINKGAHQRQGRRHTSTLAHTPTHKL